MRRLDGGSGHECEQTLGGSDGQGSLVRCSPWGRKESDTTQQLNNGSVMALGLELIVSCLKPWIAKCKDCHFNFGQQRYPRNSDPFSIVRTF